MQTFYDKLISSDTPADWKFQLTQVDLEELGAVVEATRGWQSWFEAEEVE